MQGEETAEYCLLSGSSYIQQQQIQYKQHSNEIDTLLTTV